MASQISKGTRLYRLIFARRRAGTCRVCGCTWDNPCYSPEAGYCCWWDEGETLCSHCASREIFDNPDTVHCVNGGRLQIERK